MARKRTKLYKPSKKHKYIFSQDGLGFARKGSLRRAKRK